MPVFPSAVLDDPQQFKIYWDDLQERHERRRATRRLMAFWQDALLNVRQTLSEVRTEGDADLAIELAEIEAGLIKRIGETSIPSPIPAVRIPSPVLTPPLPATTPPPLPPAVAQNPSTPIVLAPPPVSEHAQQATASILRHIGALRDTWEELKIRLISRAEGQPVHLPDRLRLRAIACGVARCVRLAYDNEVMPAVRPLADTLTHDIEAVRDSTGDWTECVAFRSEYGPTGIRAFKETKWADLVGLYERMADAEDGWTWYLERKINLTSADKRRVLDAISASQALLARAFQGLGFDDNFQASLESRLRNEEITPPLASLSPQTPSGDLTEWSRSLKERMAQAGTISDEQRKVERREEAIYAVLSLCERLPDLGGVSERLEEDRALLQPMLRECLASGVPATNKEIREALLEHGRPLLEWTPDLAKFMDAVVKERLRRKLEIPAPRVTPADPSEAAPVEDADDALDPDEEVPADVETDRLIAELRPFASGKVVTILGGVPKSHVKTELQNALGCAEVNWPKSRKSDNAQKFRSDIEASAILLVAKNFAGHDMATLGKEWVTAHGGQFVILPAGYGVKQILYQMHCQILRNVR